MFDHAGNMSGGGRAGKAALRDQPGRDARRENARGATLRLCLPPVSAISPGVLPSWKVLVFAGLGLCLTGCQTPAPSPRAALQPTTPVRVVRLPDELQIPPPPVFVPPAPVVVPPARSPVPTAPTAAVLPPTNSVASAWVGWGDWCRVKGLPPPQLLRRAGAATYETSGAAGRLTISVGNRLARWDGVSVWLAFAPQWIGGQLSVHALDAEKILAPLLLGEPPRPFKNRIVVIDPGHGGSNLGAKSILGEQYEKQFALDWAKRLRPLLEAQGWKVFLTRVDDRDMSLPERVAFADRVNAELFVSLHFNFAEARATHAGLETYCLTPCGLPSNLTRGYPDDPQMNYPNNAYDAENLRFAARLHRSLLLVTGVTDQGVRHARFMGVLRGQHRPAVLLEGGYLSNPEEARLIGSQDYRQLLAVAVAKVFATENRSRTERPGLDRQAALSESSPASRAGVDRAGVRLGDE